MRRAGLVDLTDDDRAALYGAFTFLTTMLKGDDAGRTLALWRRGGKRAFTQGRVLVATSRFGQSARGNAVLWLNGLLLRCDSG